MLRIALSLLLFASTGCTKEVAAAPLTLVDREATLQGVLLRLKSPADRPPTLARQNRLVWSVQTHGGELGMDVTRLVTGIDAAGAVSRVKTSFPDNVVVAEATDEAGRRTLVHRTKKGAYLAAHHFVPWGSELFECFVKFSSTSAASVPPELNRLVESACADFTPLPDRGNPSRLLSEGKGEQRLQLPVLAEPAAFRRVLQASFTSDGVRAHAVQLGLVFSPREKVREGWRYVAKVEAVAIPPGPCKPECNLTQARKELEGASLEWLFSLDGQLQSLRQSGGDPRGDFAALLDDVLARSTVSFASQPVAPGASWSVVEPRSDRMLRYESQQPIETTYLIEELSSVGATVVRTEDIWRVKSRLADELIPLELEGKGRTQVDFERGPLVMEHAWTLTAEKH